MRILFITWNYPPKIGGMETMLSQSVTQLKRHSDVTVIGPYANRYDLTEENTIRPKKNGILAFMLTALYRGLNFLRQSGCDVIVVGSALVSPLALFLGILFRLPVVVYIHGLDLLYKNPIYQLLIHMSLPKCDLLFANSNNTAKLAVKLRIPAGRIKVIHPGIDFSEFKILPKNDRIYEGLDLKDRLVILSAGRLAPRKGIPEFIEHVLPNLTSLYPNLTFLIAGDNPVQSLIHKADVKKRIIEAAQAVGVMNHVHLLGFVSRPQLLQLFSVCDIFVLPAIYTPGDIEGFGIVLIEAGAAGRPVFSTRLGGISDAVVDNHTGLLVESGNWAQMTAALKRLIDDEKLRLAMGENGRQRAKEKFDWPAVGKRTAGYLEYLLTNKDVPSCSCR
jgi:phosphatidylinositol alpha-1,6-mannosyltransferase